MESKRNSQEDLREGGASQQTSKRFLWLMGIRDLVLKFRKVSASSGNFTRGSWESKVIRKLWSASGAFRGYEEVFSRIS